MDEKKSYLDSKDAKNAVGIHRGPLPENGEGYDLEHIETADTITLEKVKRTPTQNLRRHWARFWCCYTLFSIIFLIIFLPIFFLLIIPAIAQRVVDNSTLLLVKADIMQPRPESVQMTIVSALKLPLGVPVRIDPMTLDLFNRASPSDNGTWGQMHLKDYVISGNTTLGVDKQFTPLNVTEWTQYVHNTVFMKHAPLSARGKTTAYLGQIKNHVTMNKDIPQTTLNSFEGFAIKDTQLLLPARDDGTNLLANATLPNPSVLTLEIGTTTLDVKSGDLVIGNATLDNLILRPGNHSTPVHGMLDLRILIKNLRSVLATQLESIRDGYLTLDTVGKTVFYDGTEVPYYTNVMKKLTMTAQVPLGGLITNTLRGVLHPGGGDNIFSDAADSMNMTEGGQNLLDHIAGKARDESSAESSIQARDFEDQIWDDLVNDPAKRDAILDVIEGLNL
ncbi:hypothetical protein P170DRAFT_445175 [Aspergillus steynii IBT 23096]|uniref:Uncharacterized protein n=1 Tax=Aspergillus steynii IBT 23096 TaxID=1392250 RepID=A0A2I2GKP1_9EURO|nr:uncharacterized protein P170DRAFT_445175 [Aspergillus steynii IBT 23096]PLB53419.1 hypothetical protein P170DRAFT_445175 [Aspergillus steynii IBT 23096]